MQRSNCGNVHPILKMMPNILKEFINVKKPDFTQFMKMFCTARVLLTPFPDSGTHPKQLKNLILSLSLTSEFVLLLVLFWTPGPCTLCLFLSRMLPFIFLGSLVLMPHKSMSLYFHIPAKERPLDHLFAPEKKTICVKNPLYPKIS